MLGTEYHQRKEEEFKLLKSTTLEGPAVLSDFVANYINNFPTGKEEFAFNEKVIKLFEEITELYIQIYIHKLNILKSKKDASSADIADLLESFISGFPNGPKSIIHFQDNTTYQNFGKMVVSVLQRYNGTDQTTYTLCKQGDRRNQCIEAQLLQHLSKLYIPMETKDGRPLSTPLNAIVDTLISKAECYFNKHQSYVTHAIFTLASLSNFAFPYFNSEKQPDLPPSSTSQKKQRKMVALSFAPEKPLSQVERFIRRIKENIIGKYSSQDPGTLINALHAFILLSKKENGFTTHITPKEASMLLDYINVNLTLSLDKPKDVKLAQQLFQIRNVYADVFPQELSAKIAPFIEKFRATTHGSSFETYVQGNLRRAASELGRDYSALVQARLFTGSNPISDELGLESDITYDNGLIKVCIQVDGDKFHHYTGTKQETQKTKLRDHCFGKNNWKLIKFTDSCKDLETTKNAVFNVIILPTYEEMTKKNLYLIETFLQTGKDKISKLEMIKGLVSAIVPNNQELSRRLGAIKANCASNPKFNERYAAIEAYQLSLNRNVSEALSLTGIVESLFEDIQLLDKTKCKTAMVIASALEENAEKIRRLQTELQSHLDKAKENDKFITAITEKIDPIKGSEFSTQRVTNLKSQLLPLEAKRTKLQEATKLCEQQITQEKDKRQALLTMLKSEVPGSSLVKRIDQLPSLEKTIEQLKPAALACENQLAALAQLEADIAKEAKLKSDMEKIKEAAKQKIASTARATQSPSAYRQPTPLFVPQQQAIPVIWDVITQQYYTAPPGLITGEYYYPAYGTYGYVPPISQPQPPQYDIYSNPSHCYTPQRAAQKVKEVAPISTVNGTDEHLSTFNREQKAQTSKLL